MRSSNCSSPIWQREALADITWMCGLLNSLHWGPNAITHCAYTSLNVMQCLEPFSLGNVTHSCHFPACGMEGFQMRFELTMIFSGFQQWWYQCRPGSKVTEQCALSQCVNSSAFLWRIQPIRLVASCLHQSSVFRCFVLHFIKSN